MRLCLTLLFVMCVAGVSWSQCTVAVTYPPTGTALPNAPQNQLYPSWDNSNQPWTLLTASVTPSGCQTITGWSVSSGSLPTGISLLQRPGFSTWYIVGQASGAIGSTSSFTLQVTGSLTTGTSNTSITVTQPVPTFSPTLTGYIGDTGGVLGHLSPSYAQFTSPQTVTLAGTVGGATICYTLNYENTLVPSYSDTEPRTNGAGACTGATLTYSAPITVSKPTLIRAVATKSGQADSNITPGFYDIITAAGPALLPQTWISTTLTNSPYTCLATAVNKTVGVGKNYATLVAAIAAIPTDTSGGTQCETITIDDNSTGFATAIAAAHIMNLQYAMQAGKWVQFRPSGYASLPAQGSDGASCTGPDMLIYPCAVSPASRTHMWKIVKTVQTTNFFTFDTAFAICGDITTSVGGCTSPGASTSGFIFTGMDFEFTNNGTGCTPGSTYCQYMYDGFLIGDFTNTTPPSNLVFDRDSFDTVSGAYDTYSKSILAISSCKSCAVVDSYFEHNWEPANTGSEAPQGQDILVVAGPGPIKVVNNWLGGTPSENLMVGGTTGGITYPLTNSTNTNCINNGTQCPSTINMGWPHDVEFRRNIVAKNPLVMNNPNSGSCNFFYAAVANLFEFKGGGERLLNEGNIYLYSPAQASGGCYQQNGNIFALKIDQNGPPWCPLCNVGDLTIRYNYGSHANISAVAIGQDQSGKQYPVMQRVSIYGNLLTDINHAVYGNTTINEWGILTEGGGGGVGVQSLQINNPGPWYLNFTGNAFYSTPTNKTGLTWLGGPLGCNTPPQPPESSWPFFTFINNISVNDGKSGTAAGAEILDGDCGQSPHTLFANLAFNPANMNWGNGSVGNGTGTGNILFNFSTMSGSTYQCNTTSGAGGWAPTNPGVCPNGNALSPGAINSPPPPAGTGMGINDYADCAAATAAGAPNSTLSACNITGLWSSVGPVISTILSVRNLGNDYYATGSPITIQTTFLPNGYLSTLYNASLTASGGTGIYTWSATSGSLSAIGLSLNTSTGAIIGTPTMLGIFPFTFEVCDTTPTCATPANLTIGIATGPLTITTTGALPNGLVGTAYTATIVASGGFPPYTWSSVGCFGSGCAGNNIPGLTMTTVSNNGIYSGTPTLAGIYTLSVQVKDSTSATNIKAFPAVFINNPGHGGQLLQGISISGASKVQ